MSIPREDVLVVLREDDLAAGRSHLESCSRVLQQGSPRVFSVRRPSDLSVLRDGPGILAVIEDTAPPHLLASLDEGEALFVQAWQQQPRMDQKNRGGEGLSWDAPGFEPPDPPQ